MTPLTISPQSSPQCRLTTPWRQWDTKQLARYDSEKPAGYEECLSDAKAMVRREEDRCEDLYNRYRGRGVWAYVTGIGNDGPLRRVARLDSMRLEPEDFSRRLVKEFFRWKRNDLFVQTNRGREIVRNVCDSPTGQTYSPVPLLMGTNNTRSPETPLEAHQNARRNLAIFRSQSGMGARQSRILPHEMWGSMPNRTVEDLLLFFNYAADPRSEVANDLFLWAKHADEGAGVRLGERLVDGEFDYGTSVDFYNALLFDNDFVELLKEKF